MSSWFRYGFKFRLKTKCPTSKNQGEMLSLYMALVGIRDLGRPLMKSTKSTKTFPFPSSHFIAMGLKMTTQFKG